MVVAATIFAFIAASIGTSLFSGIKIWNKAKNIDYARANFLLDLDRVTQNLYQCVKTTRIDFEGTSQQFSFPAVRGDSILKIVYKFNPGEKALYESRVGLKDVIADKDNKNKEYPSTKILSMDEFSVAYFKYDKNQKAYVESDSWTKDNGAFEAIELRGKFKDEKFTKKIFIPISG